MDAAFKQVVLPGGKVLHLIKKKDLIQEGPAGAKGKNREQSMGSIRSQTMRAKKNAPDDEFFPSDDDRSWSGRTNASLTKDEDFIEEEEDARTVWEIMRGADVDIDDSDDHESSKSGSSLRSAEVELSDYSGTDEDFVNDYYVNSTQAPEDKVLFGGKIKIKKGLKDKKKHQKAVRSMRDMAQKRNVTKAKRRQLHRQGGGIPFDGSLHCVPLHFALSLIHI